MKNRIKNAIIGVLVISNLVTGIIGLSTYNHLHNVKKHDSIAFDDIRHAEESNKTIRIIDKYGNIYIMDKQEGEKI